MSDETQKRSCDPYPTVRITLVARFGRWTMVRPSALRRTAWMRGLTCSEPVWSGYFEGFARYVRCFEVSGPAKEVLAFRAELAKAGVADSGPNAAEYNSET